MKWGKGTGKPPEFPGAFFGHCVIWTERVRKGQGRFDKLNSPVYTDRGQYPEVPIGWESGRFAISEIQDRVTWIWDGSFWVDTFTWNRRHTSAGRILARKGAYSLPSHDSPTVARSKGATLPSPPSRKGKRRK
jgi:hypothetical protein